MMFCPRDGRCYSLNEQANCENSKPDCPTGFVRCKDGSCVREQEKCSDANTGCPSDTPIRCVTTHKCIDPNKSKCPSASFCPENMPHRCPRGLCVRSAADCPDIDSTNANVCIKLGLGKIVCSNGRCVNDSRECESVWPCDPSWVRCSDGSCRPPFGNCSNTTTTCPSTLPHRCQDGTCAVSDERCRNPSGCFGTQLRCPNGLCVFNSSECTSSNDQDAPLANGCSKRKPHRCSFTGECVQLESYCLNSEQCPSWSPFRCPATRTCMKDAVECSSSTPQNCTDYQCPITGECVADLRLCKNQFGCPFTAPVRCTSGECMPSAYDCPRLVRCTDDKPFLCADMSCVAQQSQCRSIEKCPDEKPVRCNDGRTCVPFLANCTSNRPMCPESRPVLCSDGKTCVDNPSSCANDPNDRCRLENAKLPFFCEATGFCVPSPYDCISTLPPCEAIDGNTLVRCPSGICALPERCPPLPPCGKETPFRCRDGSCAVDMAKCEDSKVPNDPCSNAAHRRCADGVCREKCTPVDGCRPGQIMCANHKCYNVTGDSFNFTDVCRGSCDVGMVETLDGTCVNASEPIRDRKPRSFVYTLPGDGSTSEIRFSDNEEEEEGGSINIGLFDLPNDTDTTISVRQVKDLEAFVDAVRKAIQDGLILQHCSEISGVEISLLNSDGVPFEDVKLDGEVEIRLLIGSQCNDSNNANGTDICLAYTVVNQETGATEVRIEDCMGQKGYVKTTHFTPFFAVSAPTGNNPSGHSDSQHSDAGSSQHSEAGSSQTSENHNASAASHLRAGSMLLLSLIVLLLF